MFAVKIVTGRDGDGTTYDEENVLRHPTREAAVSDALNIRGETKDIFNPAGERVVRVHVDGGCDIYA